MGRMVRARRCLAGRPALRETCLGSSQCGPPPTLSSPQSLVLLQIAPLSEQLRWVNISGFLRSRELDFISLQVSLTLIKTCSLAHPPNIAVVAAASEAARV